MIRHEVLFQPIVRLADWEIVGFEALARFDDGRSPLAHLHDARSDGSLVELELRLIETALASCASLPKHLMTTVNASVETMLDPRLAEMLARDTSREWGVELSEMSAVTVYEGLRQVVSNLGLVLLIDDAGSRHSDVDRVSKSSPAVVKVDKGVLQRATDAVPDTRALREYRAAATAAGALALAEGVETPTQRRLLIDFGYDLGQGYLFGHPAPVEDWVARLPQ
ncbi:EAL domain-containing protein [Salinibacterium sp. SYSU T00001]|uniref:EAL domain-containing protein n=1 Tax=Homoserinimonas sedimenticola TaxID=2986805 RepID=UPI0022358381|nr:EAL domain-containing protein [Salinibacterium sedimenticola]MCW4386286.1 EAL domain-containing protein [Salinibacterium sedimenticola]